MKADTPELYTTQVVYEQVHEYGYSFAAIDPVTGQSTTFGTSQTRKYTMEHLIHEIELVLNMENKDSDKMLHELHQYMGRHYGKFNIELLDTNPFPFYDYGGAQDYTQRLYRHRQNSAKVAIQHGGIPYGFLSTYKENIRSLEVNFKQVIRQHDFFSTAGSRYLSHQNGSITFERASLYPMPRKRLYLDNECEIPLQVIFVEKTNKEAKKTARLEFFDD